MKILRSAVLTILAASLPMVGNVAKASQITLTQGPYSYSDGGEFTATLSGGNPLNINLSAYSSSLGTGSGNSFQTFCLESGVYFYPNTLYYYSIGSRTMPLSGVGTGSNIPLSTGAAWLYYEFGTGVLANYNYSATGTPSRNSDAGILQAAIWAFQGQSVSGFPNGITGNVYYQEALTALGSSATSDYNGTAVAVLQLWANQAETTAAQNQLVLTGTWPTPHPTPDGGTTVILLGGALAGLGALRRKLFC
jgi:hypothetical protein